ncbi:SLATT domain-containing protein [Paenibacillus odorifer]|uniref:SLATT domain-containing protein n=1 Tax=Paenibacillus odorifer TaxID=189426 RepID=UPI002DBF9CEB|nr:SLATT domain-containing protein [Paenibacillus odorifer]MEC0131517.1 SLATT domain-containing protein [Paenibacillus odorifer]MEC0220330.1 SLATT domain-containing protein [Paenibacillus odorifer]
MFITELRTQIEQEMMGAAEALDQRRKDARMSNFFMLVLSAAITIVLGIKELPGADTIAVVLGAILTASGGVRAFQKYEDQISHLSRTFFDLRLLESELLFYINSVPLINVTEESLLNLKNRLQIIIRNHAESVINFKK